MWVVNSQKQTVKNYLRPDLGSSITNISHEREQLINTISALSSLIGGSATGKDIEVIGQCQNALQSMQNAVNRLSRCRELVSQLETREFIADDEY